MALSPAVMGVLNVTPDSFFPASRTLALDEAVERGRSFFALGADVVDVGGESTRPGAEPVEESEELARVVPVVAALARYGTVSIDTQKADVARAAVQAGASIVNDVSATLCWRRGRAPGGIRRDAPPGRLAHDAGEPDLR